MMAYYFVKGELYGVPRGCVERFAPHKAGQYLAEGKIEEFDDQKHRDKPGAADARAHLRAARLHREGSGKR